MALTPIPPYVPPYAPIPTVQPFTYRDGVTYWEKLNKFIKYLNRIIIPYVNEHVAELGEEFEKEVNLLITQVNDAITADQELVDQKIADMQAQFDVVVQQIINDSIEVQDQVVAGIINDIDSESRNALDNIYVTNDNLNEKISGVNNEISTVDAKVDALETSTNNQISALETSTNNQISALETSTNDKLDVLENNLHEEIESHVIHPNDFDFRLVNGAFATSFKPSTKAVIQGACYDPVKDEWYVSQAQSDGANESAVISRLDNNGNLIDVMKCVNAGHGANISIQHLNGDIYVWLSWAYGASYKIARVKYRSGDVTETSSDIVLYDAFNGDMYVNSMLDEINNNIVIRRAPGGTYETYNRYNLNDFINGVNEVNGTISYDYVGTTPQGIVSLGDLFFILTGTANDYSLNPVNPDPAKIHVYSWKTGNKLYDISVDNYTLKNVAGNPTGFFKEVQGLSYFVDSNNLPVICLGVTNGVSLHRISSVYLFAMVNIQNERHYEMSVERPIYFDLFTSGSGVTITDQYTIITGKFVNFVIKFKLASAVSVPANGNISNITVAQINDSDLVPPYNMSLSSSDAGRMASGYIGNSGVVTITAVAPGSDISTTEELTLGGMYIIRGRDKS